MSARDGHDAAARAATARIKVKICGVRDSGTAAFAAEAGADFIGVVLVAQSPRFVAPDDARELAAAIADAGAMPVAVLRLPADGAPLDAATRAALEAFPILQVHGGEQPADLAPFRAWECWKGLHFAPAATESWLGSGRVARLVVDGPEAGSGDAWDHSALAALDARTRARCLLAGGLSPDTVGAAIRAADPWGVDVSSGVEIARGVKDHARIRAFIDAARAGERSARR